MNSISSIIIIISIILVFFSFTILEKHFKESWKATITPLASIIGSGFLIIGPMLVDILNQWALIGIITILFVAMLIGQVIAFNIRYVEPLLKNPDAMDIMFFHDISKWSLIIAYIISVAFYTRLLVSFLTHDTFFEQVFYQNLFTTFILVIIAMVGWKKNLGGLEFIEDIAVKTKLSIIFGLIIGLIIYQFNSTKINIPLNLDENINITTIAPLLAGMLLVVQGFEISRYLGHKYSAEIRIKTMRIAQIVTSFIYIIFIGLSTKLFILHPEAINETAIIEISKEISIIMPLLLLIAASMSQLSAAIADTAGSGGLTQEISKGNLKPRAGYLITTLGAIILIWLTNIFSIIVIASKAFALYYLTQSIIAAKTIVSYDGLISKRKFNLIISFLSIIILLYVILFSKAIV